MCTNIMYSLNRIVPSKNIISIKPSILTSKITVIINRNSSNNSTPTEDKIVDYDENSTLDSEQNIEILRNKSRLRPHHRNILFDQKPYEEAKAEHHLTIKYNRKLYGLYGSQSGVNPGIMWPTKDDVQERKEYEKIAFPFTIQQLVQSAQDEIDNRNLEIQKDQEKIFANMKKLETWKTEIKERIAKREAEAIAAKMKKEKLIEDVRRHFGFTVDPRDDKFKEMLAVKEKEQRKQEKQAKMDERERKAIAKLMNKHDMKSPTEEDLNNADKN